MPKLSTLFTAVCEAAASTSHASSAEVQSHEQASSATEAELQLAITRVANAYEKRLRDWGARVYRQPDGSLGPTKPAANPYAVASRRQWSRMVEYVVREQHADASYDKSGYSLRCAVNVSHDQHVKYVHAAGLEPEWDENRCWYAYDTTQTDPLKDPAHIFNMPGWKEVAEAVFAEAPRQWHHLSGEMTSCVDMQV